jgi:hypothetical protein
VRHVEVHKIHRIRWMVILGLLVLLAFTVVFVASVTPMA